MNEAIDRAIEILAKQITKDSIPHDAINLSQAILNLAHAKHCLNDVDKTYD